MLRKVCAIAEREEKPNQPVMLAALLLSTRPTSKVHYRLKPLEQSASSCCCVDTGSQGLFVQDPEKQSTIETLLEEYFTRKQSTDGIRLCLTLLRALVAFAFPSGSGTELFYAADLEFRLVKC